MIAMAKLFKHRETKQEMLDTITITLFSGFHFVARTRMHVTGSEMLQKHPTLHVPVIINQCW